MLKWCNVKLNFFTNLNRNEEVHDIDTTRSIGEIVGAIGIVISLVYLAIQIRSNTEAEKTSTYQSIVSDFGSLNNTMASAPEVFSEPFAISNKHHLTLDSTEMLLEY